MAYDEDLAGRIRELLGGRDGGEVVVEKRMFGGLAFLVGGHMAIAASGQGGLLARVDPAEADELCDRPGVEPMIMRDRPMTGWLRVDGATVTDDAALREWVERGCAFVGTLPAK